MDWIWILSGMIELLTHLGLKLKVSKSKTDIFNPLNSALHS